jgi:hypothetical protein
MSLTETVANSGLGRDIWTLPFDHITHILYIYYFDEDVYLTCRCFSVYNVRIRSALIHLVTTALPLVKISILLFYIRTFPTTWFRVASWITIFCCAGYAIAFLLVSIFQCDPISLAWTRWDGEHTGTCNNINAQVWASAAINVFLDLVIIILPLPIVYKLNINRRKKLLVTAMFCVGLMVTIVSIIRLQVLSQFGASSNFTCKEQYTCSNLSTLAKTLKGTIHQ